MGAGATPSIRIGCAGWSIPNAYHARFPRAGTHLTRYAAVFPAVEINSSFYRLHREATYRTWARSVPASFQFAIKIPREITHEGGLRPTQRLGEFLRGPAALGGQLGPLLVQLPPKFALERHAAGAFFESLRAQFKGTVVCEPRHPSWFSTEGQALFAEFEIAQVAADPAPVPEAAEPRGWRGISYFRLHGSPEKYRSSYSEAFLTQLVSRLQRELAEGSVWTIFDNTASGAAIANGLWVLQRLGVDQPTQGERLD